MRLTDKQQDQHTFIQETVRRPTSELGRIQTEATAAVRKQPLPHSHLEAAAARKQPLPPSHLETAAARKQPLPTSNPEKPGKPLDKAAEDSSNAERLSEFEFREDNVQEVQTAKVIVPSILKSEHRNHHQNKSEHRHHHQNKSEHHKSERSKSDGQARLKAEHHHHHHNHKPSQPKIDQRGHSHHHSSGHSRSSSNNHTHTTASGSNASNSNGDDVGGQKSGKPEHRHSEHKTKDHKSSSHHKSPSGSSKVFSGSSKVSSGSSKVSSSGSNSVSSGGSNISSWSNNVASVSSHVTPSPKSGSLKGEHDKDESRHKQSQHKNKASSSSSQSSYSTSTAPPVKQEPKSEPRAHPIPSSQPLPLHSSALPMAVAVANQPAKPEMPFSSSSAVASAPLEPGPAFPPFVPAGSLKREHSLSSFKDERPNKRGNVVLKVENLVGPPRHQQQQQGQGRQGEDQPDGARQIISDNGRIVNDPKFGLTAQVGAKNHQTAAATSSQSPQAAAISSQAHQTAAGISSQSHQTAAIPSQSFKAAANFRQSIQAAAISSQSNQAAASSSQNTIAGYFPTNPQLLHQQSLQSPSHRPGLEGGGGLLRGFVAEHDAASHSEAAMAAAHSLVSGIPRGPAAAKQTLQHISQHTKDKVGCAGMLDVATMTDSPLTGGPGTKINLDGLVLNETEGGLLIVNVMYNGKDYMGTLMDCTSPENSWASPRHSDIPAPDKRPKKKKTKGESEIELSARASLRSRRTTNTRRQKKTKKRKWQDTEAKTRRDK